MSALFAMMQGPRWLSYPVDTGTSVRDVLRKLGQRKKSARAAVLFLQWLSAFLLSQSNEMPRFTEVDTKSSGRLELSHFVSSRELFTHVA